MAIYAIYNPTKGKYEPHYRTGKIPALYSRKTIASEIRDRRVQHRELSWEARVVKVEIIAK